MTFNFEKVFDVTMWIFFLILTDHIAKSKLTLSMIFLNDALNVKAHSILIV